MTVTEPGQALRFAAVSPQGMQWLLRRNGSLPCARHAVDRERIGLQDDRRVVRLEPAGRRSVWRLARARVP